MKKRPSISGRILSAAIALIMLCSVFSIGTEFACAATKLKVSPASKTINIGKTVTLKSNKKVKWSIKKGKSYIKLTSKKNRSVKVKGLKKGTAYVKAKAGKKYKTIKIVVKDPSIPEKIYLKKDTNRIGGDLAVDKSCIVSVKSVVPSTASKGVTYTSSDRSIAKVNAATGLVTGVSAGDVTITATSKVNRKIKAKMDLRVVDAKAGTVQVTVDMSDEEKYPKGHVAKAWIPVPVSDDDQSITALDYSADNNSATIKETKDSAGNKYIYFEWDANVEPADRKAHMTFYVERWATDCGSSFASKERGSVNIGEFGKYMKRTAMSGSLTDGIVKDTADDITTGKKTVYDKAHAIYLWIANNYKKTNDQSTALSCDVEKLLAKRTASGCQEINAMFVALCNAEGIPARQVFGLKLQPEEKAPYHPTAKCHAEFYLPGYGWVPCDAYDAIKKIKGQEELYRGENAQKAAKWSLILDDYWGYREEGWMAVTMGRDLKLDQPITDIYDAGKLGGIIVDKETLNFVMTPYAEFESIAYADHLTMLGSVYSYEFIEDESGCGC